MAHMNNPAGRLYEILRRGKQENEKQEARLVWAKLLKVEDPENGSLILRRLAKVYELPSRIAAEVAKHENDNPELYMRWRGSVEKSLFNSSWQNQWCQVIQPIDSTTFLSLEHCDHLLARVSSEGDIDGERLRKVAEQIVELIKDVSKSDINRDVAAYIVDRLNDILRAIDEFAVTGPAGVSRAVEVSLGSAFTNLNVFVHIGEKEKPFMKRLGGVLASAAAAVTIILGAPRLPEAIQWLLPEAQLSQQGDGEVIVPESAESLTAEEEKKSEADKNEPQETESDPSLEI